MYACLSGLPTHIGLLVQVNADLYSKIDKELLEMIEDVLLNRCENSTERMLEYAGTLDPECKPTDVKKKGQAPGAKAAGGKEKSWRDLPVEQRLTHALVKGIDEFAVRVGLLCHVSWCLTPAISVILSQERAQTIRYLKCK